MIPAPKGLDMSDTALRGKSRRSTRIPLKILIFVQGLSEPLLSEGETITVNRHGALIFSKVPLRLKMNLEILVIRTGQRAQAKVVYVDPDRPRVCGVTLEKPENIWGVLVPPDDWLEASRKP